MVSRSTRAKRATVSEKVRMTNDGSVVFLVCVVFLPTQRYNAFCTLSRGYGKLYILKLNTAFQDVVFTAVPCGRHVRLFHTFLVCFCLVVSTFRTLFNCTEALHHYKSRE